MAIQIKEGRYYKDGEGNVCGPAERRECDVYPWSLALSFWCRSLHGRRQKRLWAFDRYDLVSECDKDGNPIEDVMTEAAQLVMKEGAYYEDERRRILGPMSCRNVPSSFPWVALNAVGYTSFTNTGVAKGGYDNLVREVTMPGAPEAPKPEPVTITQGMVNYAIQALVSKDKYADVERLVTAWSDVRRLVK
jgi:hypothetical protein